uniref:AAA family ATPase n=1 Tax=Dictyoglomus thermophilum TaxID=14 RepID=A0A7V3ZKG0_DICTH
MKPFTQISKPHEDILKGRLTMDVFAADLWQVAKGIAQAEYQDKDLFFRKTHITKGLREVLEIAKNRLEGKSGDPVIQLQTPFGGGKTHTLIALYHKAKEWNVKVVVLDGTEFDIKETRLWEELERQLTGKVEITKGDISPGREKLFELISKNSPVLILMDEVLLYTTKAAGIKVGDSNLAAQVFAFIQELSGVVSTVGNALLVITLPSSELEHYDENAEKLFTQLQKITGRTEKIYTPVEDDEIEYVIRKRLFQSINEKEAKEVVDEFVDYAKSEGLLSDEEAVKYRERFLKSYPFKPEVIDVLYKRWGSFPTFQRTRSVLRLLSLVIHNLLGKNIPFIRLGDFNLENNEIKRELIKHIGQEWDSIIANDIVSQNSGAKKVDNIIGSAYKPYQLGTVVGTTIFMLSFSGKGERSSTIKELKLSVLHPDLSSTVIDTVITNLREHLFYLSDEGLYFTNRPNLNKILLTREENIINDEIIEEEREIIEKYLSNERQFSKKYIWPRDHRDIPDTSDIKLIVLNKREPDRDFIEKHGESPRVYCNTMIFLCIDETQRENFYRFVRRMLALRSISRDESLHLSEAQKNEVKNKLLTHEKRLYEELRKYYRKVFIPKKDGFKEIDLGIQTFGESTNEIYNKLKNDEEILEKLSPATIKNKYLSDREYVETRKILESLWKTPGELRIMSSEIFKESIKEGVEKGIFGLGYLENGIPECKYFKENIYPEFSDNEIILKPELCITKSEEPKFQKVEEQKALYEYQVSVEESQIGEEEGKIISKRYKKIDLKLDVPKGKISDVVKVVNYLNARFDECRVKIEISAQNGEVSVSDYEDKILETLKQAGIEIEKEEKV